MKFTLCKKQCIYLALAIVSLSLAITTHVFAQEIPSSPPVSQEEAMRAQEERSDMITERQEAQKSALMERIQDRIINLSRNMERRMLAAIERLEQIVGRMDSRIQKRTAEGVDVSEAAVMLEHARTSLASARGALSGIDTYVVSGITSDNPRGAFKEIRDRYTAARNAIKDAHTHLRTTLLILKELTAESETGVSDAVSNESAGNGEDFDDATPVAE